MTQAQSENLKRRYSDPDARRKMSDALKGHLVTRETREKIGSANKIKLTGRNLSDKHRENISRATKGEENPFFGKHHSEATKEKLRQQRTGGKMPELLFHHTKYKELQGVDEGVFLSNSEHKKLHKRLRREGKCNIPGPVLAKISQAAHKRRLNRPEEMPDNGGA